MDRRRATFGLLLLAVAPRLANSQTPGRLPVIGYLDLFPHAASKSLRDAFHSGLREHGWVEGKTVLLEYRSAAGNPAVYAKLAAELVELKVDVIVTSGEGLIAAAQKATSAIPIVMATVIDPVRSGFVKSLSRPGGNMTGMGALGGDLAGKWLELMKEAVPRIDRIAVMRNSDNRLHEDLWLESQAAARQLKIGVVSVGYRSAAGLEEAFDQVVAQKAKAVVLLPDPVIGAHSARIAQLALRHKLASHYLFRDYVELGGLISYGPSRVENYRGAAKYVDRILRGAKPADLPVQQPTKFETVVNLKTARALGIAVPQSVLLRADEVIQ